MSGILNPSGGIDGGNLAGIGNPMGVNGAPVLPPLSAGAEVVQVNVVPMEPIVEKLNALIEAVNDFDDRIEVLEKLVMGKSVSEDINHD